MLQVFAFEHASNAETEHQAIKYRYGSDSYVYDSSELSVDTKYTKIEKQDGQFNEEKNQWVGNSIRVQELCALGSAVCQRCMRKGGGENLSNRPGQPRV